jgi:hypothetical protein
LLWENYALGSSGGQAQYQVTLTMERQRSGAGRIAARIVGAIASAVRIEQRDDRVVQQFDRTAPVSPAIVDHISVALGDTPAGGYRLTLEISDRATGRKTRRSIDLTLF